MNAETEKKLLDKVKNLAKPQGFDEAKTATAKNPQENVPDLTKAFENLFNHFEKPKDIKDKNGHVHVLPELDFENELLLVYRFKELIGKLKSRNWETIIDDLFNLEVGVLKEKVLNIVTILIGKDAEFVSKNFNFKGLVGLLYPFLAPIVLMKSFAPIVNILAKERVEPEAESDQSSK